MHVTAASCLRLCRKHSRKGCICRLGEHSMVIEQAAQFCKHQCTPTVLAATAFLASRSKPTGTLPNLHSHSKHPCAPTWAYVAHEVRRSHKERGIISVLSTCAGSKGHTSPVNCTSAALSFLEACKQQHARVCTFRMLQSRMQNPPAIIARKVRCRSSFGGDAALPTASAPPLCILGPSSPQAPRSVHTCTHHHSACVWQLACT